MRLSRIFRRLAALVAVAGLLFAQLVVPAYACPMMGGDDMANPNLCERDWNFGDASLDLAKAQAPLPALEPTGVAVAPMPRVTQAARVADLPVAGSAPPWLRSTVLRI